jgi:DNA-binding CsgD family transcriptional regulator
VERIEELVGLADLRAALATALDQLSPAHRQVLQLRVVEDLSYGEVARRLGISEQTARARVSRGLKTLALLLDRKPDIFDRKRTRSGGISNHYYGRGADIFIVDGAPVTASNAAALEALLEMAKIEHGLRPDELGHPFGAIGFPGGFTDADHDDHIHVGFD